MTLGPCDINLSEFLKLEQTQFDAGWKALYRAQAHPNPERDRDLPFGINVSIFYQDSAIDPHQWASLLNARRVYLLSQDLKQRNSYWRVRAGERKAVCFQECIVARCLTGEQIISAKAKLAAKAKQAAKTKPAAKMKPATKLDKITPKVQGRLSPQQLGIEPFCLLGPELGAEKVASMEGALWKVLIDFTSTLCDEIEFPNHYVRTACTLLTRLTVHKQAAVVFRAEFEAKDSTPPAEGMYPADQTKSLLIIPGSTTAISSPYPSHPIPTRNNENPPRNDHSSSSNDKTQPSSGQIIRNNTLQNSQCEGQRGGQLEGQLALNCAQPPPISTSTTQQPGPLQWNPSGTPARHYA
jgi:hypothetical protein